MPQDRRTRGRTTLDTPFAGAFLLAADIDLLRLGVLPVALVSDADLAAEIANGEPAVNEMLPPSDPAPTGCRGCGRPLPARPRRSFCSWSCPLSLADAGDDLARRLRAHRVRVEREMDALERTRERGLERTRREPAATAV